MTSFKNPLRPAIVCGATLLSLLAGCTNDSIEPTRPVASRRDFSSTKGPRTIRPEERHLADIAARAPSFAGLYYDAVGELVVRTVDMKDAMLARTATEDFRAQGKLIAGIRRESPAIRVETAEFSFNELATWRDIAFDFLARRSSTALSLDLDEVRNRVVVGVDSKSSEHEKAELKTALIALGIDSNAVVLEADMPYVDDVASAKPASYATAPPQLLTDQTSDPLAGGLMITRYDYLAQEYKQCTLGFVAQRNGQVGFVTNSHCSSDVAALDNSQQGQLFSNIVGQEAVDPNGYSCGFRICRQADAAFYTPLNGATMTVGRIARTFYPSVGGINAGSGSLSVNLSNPYFVVVDYGVVSDIVGGQLHKMGSRTGWTRGGITNTCIDHFITSNTTITCSMEANYVSDGGDSGSPVFSFYDEGVTNADTSRIMLRGIHSAHKNFLGQGNQRARFSPMSRITANLGGSWVFSQAPTLATPTLTAAVVGTTATLSWPAVSGATSYDVYSQDFFGYCDGFGCSVYGYAAVRYVTASTSFQDSRVFSYVLTPTEDGANYTTFHVIATSGTGLQLSAATAKVRIGRID